MSWRSVAVLFFGVGTCTSFPQPPGSRVSIAYLEGQVHIDGLSHFQLGSVLPTNSVVGPTKGAPESVLAAAIHCYSTNIVRRDSSVMYLATLTNRKFLLDQP